MYVIFSIWQCPYIQVIYNNNSNTCISQNIPEYQNAGFEVKTKIFWCFLSIHDRDICKLKNSASNLKQVKWQLYILKLYQPDYKNQCLNL